VKTGVEILNFGPGASPDAMLKWAQISEMLGYHSLLIADHVAITPSVGQRYPEPFYDTFATLAWLAGQTTRVMLGTTVAVLPYRHPVLTARLVANIDQFSKGRFVLGVGVGNAQDEFEVLGADHPHRGSVSDEYLRIMQALWNGKAPVSFDGRHIRVRDVSPIATLRQPRPPVWVGGNSEIAMRRAARYGDAWHPILWRSLTVDWARETGLPALKRIAAEQGRPVPGFSPRIRLNVLDAPLGGEREPGTGSLEQVRGDIAALEQMGAEHLTLDWYTGDLEASREHERGWRMIASLAEQVLDLGRETVRL
jgi:probable F420-dependent oxidoreductase